MDRARTRCRMAVPFSEFQEHSHHKWLIWLLAPKRLVVMICAGLGRRSRPGSNTAGQVAQPAFPHRP